MTSDALTTVLDAGGRYGVHPTWKGFGGELRYVMFEPDRDEAARLAAKYRHRPEVTVEAQALGAEPGCLTLRVLRHRGQSSAFAPNPQSVWFGRTRPGEGDEVARYEAPVTTIDDFCAGHGLTLDFLKSDTEGSELQVLKGAERQLDGLLGLRCETQFEPVFIGAPSFADLYGHLTARGFFLLNFDYAGRGSPCNGYFSGERYGILTGTDATWLKRPEAVLARPGDAAAVAARVAKYAAFCMANGATDVAMHMLLTARRDHNVDLAALRGTRLLGHVDVAVQKLFYTLLQHPAYDAGELEQTYRLLFDRPLKRLHEFYESDEFNPA